MASISVIIPSYNNGDFIGETIASVRGQTVAPDEIIVVDDGSTDDTERVVRGIKDERLRYYYQQNSGVSVARNLGLKVATGDFISFLDADDRWRPIALERQLRLMMADDSMICCFGNFVRFMNDTGEVLPDQFTFYPDLQQLPQRSLGADVGTVIDADAFDAIIPFADFPAFTPTMMFRASRIRDVRFDPRLIRCQDAHFVLRVFMRGNVGFTREILAEVRRHNRNATRDVDMMPIDKLKALEFVRDDPLSAMHSTLLEQRISRAQFDAAGALLLRGHRQEGLRTWWRALASDGSVLRKLTGSARLSWLALSASGRQPA